MTTNWLPLTEYSSKYQVSISTLRRRIKSEDIKFRFSDGRYLLADQTPEHRPSLGASDAVIVPSLKKEATSQIASKVPERQTPPITMRESLERVALPKNNPDEPILTAANRLLSELKKAYTQILQEKEEQILHLKEGVTDLKTLVRVLESENTRLNHR